MARVTIHISDLHACTMGDLTFAKNILDGEIKRRDGKKYLKKTGKECPNCGTETNMIADAKSVYGEICPNGDYNIWFGD